MIYTIILAAGSNQRFCCKSKASNKLLLKIDNKPIYQYACELFIKHSQIAKVVLVLPKEKASNFNFKHKKIIKCFGGKTRNESFLLGLKALGSLNKNDYIICHDAARICITQDQINNMVKLITKKIPFGSMVYKPTDTIFVKNKQKYQWTNRDNLLCIQTPQFISYGLYKKCRKNKNGSDLMSFLNLQPKTSNFIFGDIWNLKITFSNDFQKIKYFLKKSHN